MNYTDEIKLEMQDLGWLLNHLTDVAPKWINFGLSLNVPYSQLKIIEANNSRDIVACLRETLSFWLTNRCPNTGKLLKALIAKSVQEKQLASTLEISLRQGDHRKGIGSLQSVYSLSVYTGLGSYPSLISAQ